MSLSSRSMKRTALRLACLFSAALVGPLSASLPAQSAARPQFVQPAVELTGGRVSSFATGHFQSGAQPDVLYVNSYATSGTTYQVTAGELLNLQSFANFSDNQIDFTNILYVSAALADFDDDGHTDYAFALSPITQSATNLCVYYGTGNAAAIGSSYSGGPVPNAYPPTGGKSGCMSIPTGNALPHFAYIATGRIDASSLPGLIVEDSANSAVYILTNNGSSNAYGVLAAFTVSSRIALPQGDGPGPLYAADLNNDGFTDFVVNGQNGLSASVYLSNGDGTFKPPVRYTFAHNIHSLLLHTMDPGGALDMVVEGDNGVIEIHHGNGDGTFAQTSEGGTPSGVNGFSGNGGQLAAIGDVNKDGIPDILTTTPIGLSVLLGQGNYSYTLSGVYDIGPGRTSFALADFYGDGNLDLAVDSAEGVAIIHGNPDGTFQTSIAYSAGQSGLNATVADFNNDGKPDVVVATGTTVAQVLLGNGNGTFTTLPAPTNTAPSPNPTLWSNVLTADFDGDGNQDLLYSLTGLPLPTPGPGAGSGLSLQYGNGDGTFQPPTPITNQLVSAPADNNFYGESAIGDFNGDGLPDIANLDTYYYDTLLSQKAAGAFRLGFNLQEDAGTNDDGDLDSFSQVAAGFFAYGRPSMQDLVFQDDANVVPFLNSGDGVNFTKMPALSSPPNSGQYYGATILFTDINNDGDGDIIVPYHNLGANPASPNAQTPNLLYIWYGHGDGTFDPPVITTLSRNYYLAQVADMNNDGLPDLVLSDGYLIAILYNQGNRTFGQEQHFLAGQGINSISIADVNGDHSLDLIVANGGVTLSSAVAIGGGTQSSVSLTPNPDVNTGGITVLLNDILTRPVTGTLVSTPNPSGFQSSFTMTATVNPTAGNPSPTGTIQFAVNGTPVGSPVMVTPGANSSTATYSVPVGNPYSGTLVLSAAYSGDTHSSPLNLYATQAVQGSATTTSLLLCVGPTAACPSVGVVSPPFAANLTMIYGQTYNGDASAYATDGSPLDATSTIAFQDTYDGITTTLCTLSAVATGAACPPQIGTGTPAGTHVFTAVFSGDSTHASSTSLPVTIVVSPDMTTAVVTSSLSPAAQGAPVTLTATLAGPNAPTGSAAEPVYLYLPPPGTVTFLEGTTVLGTGTLTPNAAGIASTATLTTNTLPVGTDPITVTYPGSLNFLPITSGVFSQIITQATASTITLTSSQNPSAVGQAVTFTATILASGAPVTTGTVTFLDGTTVLGTGTLNASGMATFTTSTLALGNHNITATFGGNTVMGPGASAVLVQVVNAASSGSFSLSVTPTPVSVAVGNSVGLTVTVTAQNGFNQMVTLSCGNLPPEAACTFTTPTLAAGGGTSALLISTMAPHNCGATQPYFTGSNNLPGFPDSSGSPVPTPLMLPALAGIVIVLVPGRRRWLRALAVVAALAAALQITGCGTCTDLGTRPNTYTFQVTGTASGTSAVQSQTVTLNVTL